MIALAMLLFAAVVLTCAMFFSKNSMLGFPCAIFWAIAGGQSYTLSSTPWGDWQYYLFFASFGMAIFCAFAAYALRDKDDSDTDEDEYKEEQGEKGEKYVGEKDSDGFYGEDTKRSPRSQKLRDRADKRRGKGEKWGEFK